MSEFVSQLAKNSARAVSIIGLFLVFSAAAQADTMKVEAPTNKTTLIDVLDALESETCSNLISSTKVQEQAKNGTILVEIVTFVPDEGFCRGRSIQVVAIGYRPNRGFRGTDEGSISFRMPPRTFRQSQVTMNQTRKYIITVK